MIQTTDLKTEVFFAKGKDKGTISVAAYYNQLVLQQLPSHKNVRDELQHEDIKDLLPKVVCDFQTTESVDVVIAILNRIKENMRPRLPEDHLALAC